MCKKLLQYHFIFILRFFPLIQSFFKTGSWLCYSKVTEFFIGKVPISPSPGTVRTIPVRYGMVTTVPYLPISWIICEGGWGGRYGSAGDHTRDGGDHPLGSRHQKHGGSRRGLQAPDCRSLYTSNIFPQWPGLRIRSNLGRIRILLALTKNEFKQLIFFSYHSDFFRYFNNDSFYLKK